MAYLQGYKYGCLTSDRLEGEQLSYMIVGGRGLTEWIQQSQDSGGEEADRGETKAGRKRNRQHRNTKTILETDYRTSCQCTHLPPA